MSLNLKKSINSISLEATSTVNGVDVLTLSTQVTDSASYSNVQQTINNQQAYDDNKSIVRKDVVAFQDAIFDAQDQLSMVVGSNGTNDSSAATSSSAASSASSAASSASTAE